jgi:hypothetical protein
MGFDLCPFINFTIAQKIESQLDLLAHGVDKFNRYKFEKALPSDDKLPNMMPGSDFWKAENSTLHDPDFFAVLENLNIHQFNDYIC